MPEESWIDSRKTKEGLQTDFIGQEIYHFAEVASTNDAAKELAARGVEEGSVVISERQTLGRGRLGRRWISPEGGIWFSIVLRPKADPKDTLKLTLVAGVAVARILREKFNLKAEIKWPNDVLIGERKVCGILTEASTKGGLVQFVVVGIGINANVTPDAFPENLRTSLTSLKAELGEEIEREDFLRVLLEEMESEYKLFMTERFDLILKEWRSFAGFLGRYVEVVSFDERIRGWAVDIDQSGALMIKLKDGTVKEVMLGDVIVQKQPSL